MSTKTVVSPFHALTAASVPHFLLESSPAPVRRVTTETVVLMTQMSVWRVHQYARTVGNVRMFQGHTGVTVRRGLLAEIVRVNTGPALHLHA